MAERLKRRNIHRVSFSKANISSDKPKYSAKTVQAVAKILKVCDLIPDDVENNHCDNFDHIENDWFEEERRTTSFVNQLQASNQIETVELNLDLEWFSEFLRAESENREVLPMDHGVPFEKLNKNGSTKRSFCIDLQNVISQAGIKLSQINRVFEVLQRHQTSLNLPVINKNPLLKKQNGNIKNNLEAYVGKDNGTIEIDVCTNDCMAFHGLQMFNGQMVDCSKLITCLYCPSKRYSHCFNPHCADLDYNLCNPHTLCQEINTKNGFGHPNRTPQKVLYYRPITARILHMYKLSLLDGNEEFLNYFQEKNRVTRPDHVIDINDGFEVKNQIKEMSKVFREFRAKYKSQTSSDEIIYQCSLLMTLFYDGITLYDRNADSLWPLLCSVINCNPSHRSKLGVGLFLAALHNIKPGSGAEKYFLKNILAQELKQLERGILFSFDHPVSGERVRVFVQARCVYTHLDTIALQHFCQIQGSGSLAGCAVCGSIKGQYSLCLGKVIYSGERGKLETSHWLRQFGQNNSPSNDDIFLGLTKDEEGKTVDPSIDFYDNGVVTQAKIFELFKSTTLTEKKDLAAGAVAAAAASAKKNKKKVTPKKTVITPPFVYGVSLQQMKDAADPTKGPPHPSKWYNNMFPLILFKDALYYPLRDTRSQQFYAHNSNANYLRDGTIAEENRQEYIDSFQGGPLPKTKKTFAVNGIHGVNPLVRELKGYSFERMCYDLMHFCSNAGSYFLEFFKGGRGLSDIQRRCCVAQGIFPVLAYKNVLPPWRLQDRDISIVDSLVNALLVPSGFSRSYSMKFPARRTGHLRAKEHTIFMTAYAHYVYSFTRMKKPYTSFVARFASDLNRLLNPCIAWSELNSLIKSVYETGGIREGMFPDSEKQLIFHEIVDIANHVRQLGHVSGSQCYSGERSLSTIGRLRGKGGLHYVKGLLNNYVALENTYKYDTQIKFEFLDNSQPVQKYSDFVLKLHGNSESRFALNSFEMDMLCGSIINVLNAEIDGSIIIKSSFYRLHAVYKACKEFKRSCFEKNRTMSFYSWIILLHNRFQTLERAGFDHVYDGVTDQYDDLICGVLFDFDELIKTNRLEEVTKLGFLLLSDFTGILKDVVEFRPTIHKKAIIKGLTVSGRGKVFRETQQSRRFKHGTFTVSHPTNPLNNLNDNWWKSDDYSSWCKIMHYDPNEVQATTRTKTEMGQANYFFRLNWESDRLLCGLAFANMTLRHTSYDAHTRHHYISFDGKSFNGLRQFVCLNYVCSTKLALSVLDKDRLPIVRQRKFGTARWTVDKHVINIAPANASVHRIYFLEMHPERTDYMYRGFEDDLDGTKKWDVL